MNYRDCLILAAILFLPNNRFDCETFAKLLFIYKLYRISTDSYYHTLKQITKRTSSDLDRLYKMGFLRRKRLKRTAITRGGQVRSRGFKYEYALSKQGRQYFIFLLKQMNAPRPERTWEITDKPILTGDPTWEPVYRKIIESRSPLPPSAVGLFYEYMELTGNKGGRYNRFPASGMERRLLFTLMLCAQELQGKFDAVLARTDTFMAEFGTRHSDEDVRGSRIVRACQSIDEGAEAMIKIILALADRVRRFLQSGLQLPVSKKHPYVIVEVEEMLQRMASQHATRMQT